MKKLRSSWNADRVATCDLNKSLKAVFSAQVKHLRTCSLEALYPQSVIGAYELRAQQIDDLAAQHTHDREFILNLRKINACLLKELSLATCFKFDKWGYPVPGEAGWHHAPAVALRIAA